MDPNHIERTYSFYENRKIIWVECKILAKNRMLSVFYIQFEHHCLRPCNKTKREKMPNQSDFQLDYLKSPTNANENE